MLPLLLSTLLLSDPPATQPSDLIPAALARIFPDRAHAAVTRLAAFGTRHSLSADSPDRGFLASARWIKYELESLPAAQGDHPRLTVELESFDAPPSSRIPKGGQLTNVVARLRGSDTSLPPRLVYLSAHLDSRNGDPMDADGPAPGANDDASGCAVLLEVARALADAPLRATVVFLFTAGEEQGLTGATYHASQAAARKDPIIADLNNDIVGGCIAPDPCDAIRVFSEGLPRNPSTETLAALRAASAESDSPSRQLARFIAEVAAQHKLPVQPRLIFRPDRFLRGGDHSAFNDAGFPAVRFTDVAEFYDRQHQNVTTKDGKPYGDVPDFVSGPYLAGVARLNAAAAMHLAMAPPAPTNVRIIAAQLTTDTTLRWDNPPNSPEGVTYEVVWRDTTSPVWQHSRSAGDAAELTLPISKDDHFLGVRARSADGYLTPVVFAMPGRQ